MNWQDILKKPKPESPRKKALKRAKAKGLSGLNSPRRKGRSRGRGFTGDLK